MPKFRFIDALSFVTEKNFDKVMSTLKEMLERYPETDMTQMASSMLRNAEQGRKIEGGGGNVRGMLWATRVTNDSTAVSDKELTPFTDAPDTPQYLQCLFEKGNIIGLQTEGLAEIMAQVGTTAKGEKDGYTLLDPLGVMLVLNYLGGKHGIGILDIVENRLVGMKCRGVYETPGGSILYKAHSVLESICLDKMTLHEKQRLAITYAELVYNGQWFTPLREALAAFVDKTQETVTGKVKLKLYKGNMINAGVWSPYSLYSEEIATFGESDYNQADAAGFINLYGLPIKVKAMVDAMNK